MTAPSSRVAVVTGAARGLGAATALRLAADGMAVAVIDLEESAAKGTADAITEAGGRSLAVGADVADAAAVDAAVDRIVAELGAPTVLINNAGVTRDNMLFKMTDTDWDVVMNVHLRGAFLMSRAVQKYMIDAKWGRIVNLSSVSALGNRGQANYSTAKAGLQGFTKTLAIELGKFGVTANAIAPGPIETPLLMGAKEFGEIGEKVIETMKSSTQMGRLGQPDEVGEKVELPGTALHRPRAAGHGGHVAHDGARRRHGRPAPCTVLRPATAAAGVTAAGAAPGAAAPGGAGVARGRTGPWPARGGSRAPVESRGRTRRRAPWRR